MKQTRINGYFVELESADDCVQGWVTNGRFSASIECMYGTGTLTDGYEDFHVPESIREKIYSWALANGY